MFVSFSISQSVSYLHIWCGWWGGVQVCPSLPLLVWSAALWSHTLCLGPDAITYSWGSWQHESPSRCRMSYDTQPTRKCIYFHTQWANAADSEVFLVVFFFFTAVWYSFFYMEKVERKNKKTALTESSFKMQSSTFFLSSHSSVSCASLKKPRSWNSSIIETFSWVN